MPIPRDNKLKVWLVRISNMGGKPNDYMVHAYADEKTCRLRCKDLTEEFQDYIPEEAEGEVILTSKGEQVIVDRQVYDLDRTDVTEEIKERAKKKLDPEEIEALGL